MGSFGRQWSCLHHRCATCNRGSAAAGGLLFRCLSCPTAFCEDHLPSGEAVVVGQSARFQALGADHPKQACYVICSTACRTRATAEGDVPAGSVATAGILAATGLDTTKQQRGAKAAGSGTVGSGSSGADSVAQLVADRAAAMAAVSIGSKVRQRFLEPVADWCDGRVVSHEKATDVFTVSFDGALGGATVPLDRAAVARILTNPPKGVRGTSFQALAKRPKASGLPTVTTVGGGSLVGRTVRKAFPPQGAFGGRVVSHDVTDGIFLVEYEDGDLEEMSFGELETILECKEPEGHGATMRRGRGGSIPTLKGSEQDSEPNSLLYAPQTRVSVLFDGDWFSGCVAAAVPAGLRVNFDADNSSCVVPSGEVQERVRPHGSVSTVSGSPTTASPGNRSRKRGSTMGGSKEVSDSDGKKELAKRRLGSPFRSSVASSITTSSSSPRAPLRPFKQDLRTPWERLSDLGRATLLAAYRLGAPVALGTALGPLALLSRHLRVAAETSSLAEGQRMAGAAAARQGYKPKSGYLDCEEAEAAAIAAALTASLDPLEADALSAALLRLAPVMFDDLAEDPAKLAKCSLADLANRVASWTGAQASLASSSAGSNAGADDSPPVIDLTTGTAAVQASPEEGWGTSTDGSAAAQLYLEFCRELESWREYDIKRCAWALGIFASDSRGTFVTIRPGMSGATPAGLIRSLAAFLTWPRHGLTYLTRVKQAVVRYLSPPLQISLYLSACTAANDRLLPV